MIRFEEALNKAKALKPDIDGGTDWEKGFVFSSSKNEGNIGGPGPVVILKESGEAVNMSDFMLNNPGKMIKDFEL